MFLTHFRVDSTSQREQQHLKQLRKAYMAQKSSRLTKYKNFPLNFGPNALRKDARFVVVNKIS